MRSRSADEPFWLGRWMVEDPPGGGRWSRRRRLMGTARDEWETETEIASAGSGGRGGWGPRASVCNVRSCPRSEPQGRNEPIRACERRKGWGVPQRARRVTRAGASRRGKRKMVTRSARCGNYLGARVNPPPRGEPCPRQCGDVHMV